MIAAGALRLAVLDVLRREEGLRLTVYDDANGLPIRPGSRVIGHPTIGIGRALDVRGITQAEAEHLLGNDVAELETQVAALVPCFGTLSQARQAVLVTMAYQMGIGGLRGFSGTLAAVQSGRYGEAADRMLASAWARQTPARAQRMAALMRAGE